MQELTQEQQTTESTAHSIDDPNYYFLIDKEYYKQFQNGEASLEDCVYFNTFHEMNDHYNDEEEDFETYIERFNILNLEEYKQFIMKHFSMKFYEEEGEIPYFDKIHDKVTDSEISNTRHSYESKLIVFEPTREVKKKLKLKNKDIPLLALEYCYYDYYGKYTEVEFYEATKYRKTMTAFRRK